MYVAPALVHASEPCILPDVAPDRLFESDQAMENLCTCTIYCTTQYMHSPKVLDLPQAVGLTAAWSL
jgi:hypothetical protein